MKTKAESVQVFELRMWSKTHYGESVSRKDTVNIYNGTLIHSQSKEKKHFHSPADLLKAIEKIYFEQERKKA